MSSSSLLLLFLLPLLISSSSSQQNNDTDVLIRFRTQTDAHGNLAGNWTSGDACSGNWEGVKCIKGRVTSLSLPSLHLRGPIDYLAPLDQLRLLDLHGNRLNGTLLPIFQCCTNLKLLYLSSNDFSGGIPDQIGLLKRLLRLDLSDNNLRGPIPDAISNLTRLLTLRLQNNVLSGQLPDHLSAELPNLIDFNVSNNELYGKVPDQLMKKFGEVAFAGNAGLCGSAPFPTCSFSSYSPPWAPAAQTVVPSNPSSIPGSTAVAVDEDSRKKKDEERGKGLGTGAVVAIVVGNAVVLLVIASFFVAYYCGRKRNDIECNAKKKNSGGSDTSSLSLSETKNKKGCYSSNVRDEEERSKLVFFERRKQFELEDLLRASAEMVGKGSLGSVYKAILEDGCVVAVKRLKDANPFARKDFEKMMDIIGKLRHPNIVRLRAYYYAKEEKLLVYDYLSNGSFYSLLHRNRGPGRIPLDWTTRISLVLGAARGLARIHEEYSSSNVPHGNVKSSNVLIDKNGVACISDFGLPLLLDPVSAISRLGGYRAPEQAESKKLSQMADVYSFGVLLLEVLTGRAPAQYPPTRRSHDDEEIDLPKWVRSIVKEEWTAEVFDAELLRYKNIEEELVAMLHLALACVVQQPNQRPTMSEVAKMIEDIRVEQSPLGEEFDESRNSLSPSVTTTEDALPIY